MSVACQSSDARSSQRVTLLELVWQIKEISLYVSGMKN